MKRILYIVIALLLNFNILNGQTLRIEPQDLVKNIYQYKILDTRDSEKFNKGHIKNAINFPISLSYENAKLNGKITQPIKMQKIIQNLGLNNDDKIIIYDDGSFFDAARLFWAFEVYGFKKVKLLNSGFKQWEKLNFPISTVSIQTNKSNYIASINFKRLATKFTTQIASRNPNQVIIDARGTNAYLGKESSAKRFGHIPNALDIAAKHNINYKNNENKLKSINELKELYKGIKREQKVVIYCAIGRISSTNYFALRELGYDVSNYDASWKEWGNDNSLPIVKRESN